MSTREASLFEAEHETRRFVIEYPGLHFRSRCLARYKGLLDQSSLENRIRGLAIRNDRLDDRLCWLPPVAIGQSAMEALAASAPVIGPSDRIGVWGCFHRADETWLGLQAPASLVDVRGLDTVARWLVGETDELSGRSSRTARTVASAEPTDAADAPPRTELPLLWPGRRALGASGVARPSAPLAGSLLEELCGQARWLGAKRDHFVLGLWLAFIGRITDQPRVGVAVLGDALPTLDCGDALHPARMPCPIQGTVRRDESIVDFWRRVGEPLASSLERFGTPAHHTAVDRPVVMPIEFESLRTDSDDVSSLEIVDIECRVTPWEAKLYLIESAGSLRLRLDVASQPLQEERSRFLLEGFTAFLEAFVDAPTTPLGRLPAMGATEQRRVCHEWNRRQHTKPRFESLPCAVRAQAIRTPDSLAIVSAGGAISYRELEDVSNRVVHTLLERGAARGQVIPIIGMRTSSAVIAMLAVSKLGAAYAPLDPGTPPRRLGRIVTSIDPPFVLADERLMDSLEPYIESRVSLDELVATSLGSSSEPVDCVIEPDDLAYVIHTSGSTGVPKGVMISHGSLVSYLGWAADAYDAKAPGSSPVHTSLAVDLTITSIFPPLISGGTIEMIEENPALEQLAARIRTGEPISLLKVTPSHLDPLALLIGWDASVGSLGSLVVGGEALHAEKLEFWRSRFPGVRIFNEYGPTEATVGCCVQLCPDDVHSGPIPIGRPISGTTLYVLDAHQQPVSIGAIGELFIGGEGVALGYWRSPEETKARFVPDSWSNESGGRVYRTGDRVGFRLDGTLEYHGREDDQVTVRGHRVELGEIEAVLVGLPSVRDAVALAPPSHSGGARIVAFVVPTGNAPAESIVAALEEELPSVMVPSIVELIDRIPLTSTGKADRTALAEEAAEIAHERPPYVGPRDHRERCLASIWIELLGVDDVGINDDFFDLGGDSILAIQVVDRLREHGYRIAVGEFINVLTLAEVAARMSLFDAVVDDGSDRSAGDGPAVGAEAPLAPLQSRFIETCAGEPDYFNMIGLARARESISAEAFARAWREVVARHPALRVRFERRDGAWLQRDAGGDPEIRYFDLGNVPVESRDDFIELSCRELQRALCLEEGKVCAAAFFDPGDHGVVELFLVVHHAVCDAFSFRVLWKDLGAALREGDDAEAVQPPATSFLSWVRWLKSFTEAGGFAREVDFWLAQNRLQAPRIPVDRAVDREDEVSTGREVCVELSAAETEQLMRSGEDVLGGRFEELLIAALVRTIAAWQGDPAVQLSLEGHGRDDLDHGLDLSRSVGWFTTSYSLHFCVPEGSFRDVVERVRSTLRVVPRRGLGLVALREFSPDAQVRSELAAAAEPEIAFVYMGRFDMYDQELFQEVQRDVGPNRSPRARRPFPITVSARVGPRGLQVRWGYSTERHDEDTISGIAHRFRSELLAATVATRIGLRPETPKRP